jgi:hypothetical protein
MQDSSNVVRYTAGHAIENESNHDAALATLKTIWQSDDQFRF